MPEAADETPLAVAQAYAAAWANGDAATLIALYHDDIVLHYSGEGPLAGDHIGKPAALAVLGRIQQAVRRETPEIHDVLASDTHAAILAKERWHDGDAVRELHRVLLYHVLDGKLAECWIYDDDQRLVDAVLSKALS
jgi:ketosteroid isomerase-like protein